MEAAHDDVGRGKTPATPTGSSDHSPIGGTAAYAAELLGTFALVLFIVFVLSVFATNPVSVVGTPSSTTALGYVDWSVIGLVHTFILMAIVVSIGVVSGAHVNPAITLGMLSRRLISPIDAVIYIAMQVVGAILAVLVVKLLINTAAENVNFGAPSITEKSFLDGSLWKGFIAEMIGTFFLMWAIMSTVVFPKGRRNLAGIAIGATLGLAVMCIGPMTGGSFNPARAFAPLLIGDFGSFWDFLVAYVLGPIVGATVATWAYTLIVINPSEQKTSAPTVAA